MAKQDIRAGGAFVELSLKRREFLKGLQGASQTLQNFGRQATAIGKRLSILGASITAPFIAGLRTFATFGDELEKMSRRTGVSVESLSRLQHAAEQSGASTADLEAGIRGMNRFLVDLQRGLSTATDTATDLGITFDQLEKMTPEERAEIARKAAEARWGDK